MSWIKNAILICIILMQSFAYAKDVIIKFTGEPASISYIDAIPEIEIYRVTDSASLYSNSEILFVEELIETRIAATSEPYYSNQWYLDETRADLAWQEIQGNPYLKVAVLDTGINFSHEDLSSIDGFSDSDDNGHGTFVAGIINGIVNNGIGISGISKCRLLPYKVFDSYGKGNSFTLSKSIVAAVNDGAKIINISGGTPDFSYALKAACDYAYDAGVVIIAASGNTNSQVQYPAQFDNTIAVGASNHEKYRCSLSDWGYDSEGNAQGSCFGDSLDLVAPGVDIYSADKNIGYVYKYGTSCSSAIVSGAAALMLSKNSELTPAAVKSYLIQQADDITPTGKDIYTGYGILNIEASLLQVPADGSDPSGDSSENSGDSGSENSGNTGYSAEGFVNTPADAPVISLSPANPKDSDDIVCTVTPASDADIFSVISNYDTNGFSTKSDTTGSKLFVADGSSGMVILDISDPKNPAVLGNFVCSSAKDVKVSGNYAYIADGINGLKIVNISNPAVPALSATYDTPGSAQGIALYGNICAVADNTSVQIISAASPTSPYLLSSVPLSGTVKDVEIYSHYIIAACGTGGISIIDISSPSAPSVSAALALTAEDTFVYKDILTVASADAGLKLYNIASPFSPSLLSTTESGSYAYGVAAANGHAFVAAGYSGMYIIDISTSSPQVVKTISTPDSTTAVNCFSNFAVSGSGMMGIQLFSTAQPSALSINSVADSFGTSILRTNGSLLFAASGSLLKTFSVDFTELSQISTGEQIHDMQVAGNVYAACTGSLKIYSAESSPLLLGSCLLNGIPESVSVKGNYAAVSLGSNGVDIISVCDPSSPSVVSHYSAATYAADSAFFYPYLAISDTDGAVIMADISNPSAPYTYATHTISEPADILISGCSMLIKESSYQIAYYNIASLNTISETDRIILSDTVEAFILSGNYLYVSTSTKILRYYITDSGTYAYGSVNSDTGLSMCAGENQLFAAGNGNFGYSSLFANNLLYTYKWYVDSGSGFVEDVSLFTEKTTSLSMNIFSADTAQGQTFKCEVIPWDGIAYGTSAIASVTVNTPPSVTISGINGSSNYITIVFNLEDNENNPCDLAVFYKGGTVGSTWTIASVTGVKTSVPTGNGLSLIWNSQFDQSNAEASNYQIKIVPTDIETGISAISQTFSVDNKKPVLLSAALHDAGNYGAGINDTIVFTFSEAISAESIVSTLIDGNEDNSFTAGYGNIAGTLDHLIEEIGAFALKTTVTASECRLTLSSDGKIATITLGGEIVQGADPEGEFTASLTLKDLAGNIINISTKPTVSGTFGAPSPEDSWHTSLSSLSPNPLQADGYLAYEPSVHPLAPLTAARRYMASTVYNKKIYIAGGFTSAVTNSFQSYNPASNTWETLIPMTYARQGLTLSAVNGKIYAIGGGNPDDSMNTVECYDIATGVWSVKSPLLTPRRGHTASVIGKKIYVAGGFSNGSVLKTLEVYDTETDSWTALTSMVNPRFAFGAAVIEEKIYVIGGYNGTTALSSVECYDPQTGSWSTQTSLPVPKYAFGCAVYNQYIITSGGYNMNTLSRTDRFDTREKKWKLATGMTVPRSFLRAETVGKDLYFIGGSSSAGITQIIEKYTPFPIHTEISAPAFHEAAGGEISVKGSVQDLWDSDFKKWELSWGLGFSPDSYTVISSDTSEITAGTFEVWNTSEATNEETAEVTIKLKAEDKNGHIVYTYKKFYVDNASNGITSPEELEKISEETAIIGNAQGIDFESYVLEYGEGKTPTLYYPVTTTKYTPVTDGTLEIWNVLNRNGFYTLRLTLNKKSGASQIFKRIVEVCNKPEATLTAPASKAQIHSNTVFMSASGVDKSGTGLAKAEFTAYFDSAWHTIFSDTQETYEYSWDLTGVQDQTVEVGVFIYDNGGNKSDRASCKILVDRAPTGEVIIPAAGAIVTTNSVDITALVTDRTGTGIKDLVFYVFYDNTLHELFTDTQEPYTTIFDASDVSNQTVEVRIKVTDNCENFSWFSSKFRLNKETNLPTGFIAAPTADEILHDGITTITATASDDSGIKYVEFFAYYNSKWKSLGQDTESPYEYEWNYTDIADQKNVQLKIHVKDTMGNIAIAPGGIISGLEISKKPSGKVIYPLAGTTLLTTDLDIVAEAEDHSGTGIKQVKFIAYYNKRAHILATLSSTPYTYHWDLSQIPNQSGIWVAVTIEDNDGNIAEYAGGKIKDLILRRETVKPYGSISAPADKEIITVNKYNVIADVADNSGIKKVEFYYTVKNRTILMGTDYAAPYECIFDATGIPDNPRIKIYCIAEDIVGNRKALPKIGTRTGVVVSLDRKSTRSIKSPERKGVLASSGKVYGNAYGPQFTNYTLSLGKGNAPVTYTTVSTSSSPVTENILGVVNTSGKFGTYTVKLSVMDGGEEYVDTCEVKIGNFDWFVPLFNAKNAYLEFFNPSADSAFVTMEIYDESGNLKEIFTDTVNSKSYRNTSQKRINFLKYANPAMIKVSSNVLLTVSLKKKKTTTQYAVSEIIPAASSGGTEFLMPFAGFTKAFVNFSNISASDASVTIKYYDETGVEKYTDSYTVPKFGSIQTPNIRTYISSGSVRISSDNRLVTYLDGLNRYRHKFYTIDGNYAAGKDFYFSLPTGKDIQITMSTDSALSPGVTVSYHDKYGSLVATESLAVPKYGCTVTAKTAPSTDSVFIRIQSTYNIVVTPMFLRTRDCIPLRVLPVNYATARKISFVSAHARGAHLHFMNPGTETAQGTLWIFNHKGQLKRAENIVIGPQTMLLSKTIMGNIHQFGKILGIYASFDNPVYAACDANAGATYRTSFSNPFVDKDNDALPDVWEEAFGLDTSANDADDDPDMDGMTNAESFDNSVSPIISDSDNDGLTDYEEISIYNTNPNSSDTDSDKLEDGDEIMSGADPLVTDTDLDGIDDYTEVITYSSNPAASDTDLDGISDFIEMQIGTSLTDASDKPHAYAAVSKGTYSIFLCSFISEEDGNVYIQNRNKNGKLLRSRLKEVSAGIRTDTRSLLGTRYRAPVNSSLFIYSTAELSVFAYRYSSEAGITDYIEEFADSQGKEFVLLANNPDYSTATLLNTEDSIAMVTADIYDTSGNFVNSLSSEIPAYGAFSISDIEKNLKQYGAYPLLRITTDKNCVAEVMKWSSDRALGFSVPPLTRSAGKEFRIPLTLFESSSVGIANVSPSPANITFTILSDSGEEKYTTNFELARNAQVLSSSFVSIFQKTRPATVVISSTEDIVVDITSIGATDAAGYMPVPVAYAQDSYIVPLSNASSYSFNFSNHENYAAELTLAVYNENGILKAEKTLEIPAYGVKNTYDNIGDLKSLVKTGYVKISSAGNNKLSASAVYWYLTSRASAFRLQ